MKSTVQSQLGLALVVAVVVSGACAGLPRSSQACDVDRSAEEHAIRMLSARYGEVRDVETEVGEFTDDVWFFSPLTPTPTVGRVARRRIIERRRAPYADEHTRRATTGVVVSQCGDLAVEHGRFVTSWTGPAGPDSVVGYYLMSFRKVAGEWKVAAASVHRAPSALSAEPARAPDHAERGLFIEPSGGTTLLFCSAPSLSVTLKVDSASTGGTRIAMGTAAIAVGGSNAGTHRDVDEVNYFLEGQGRAFIGSDTTDIRPGLVMYVPQGVRHGFANTGNSPLRFVWSIAPQGLASGFRSRGVAPGTVCPPPGP